MSKPVIAGLIIVGLILFVVVVVVVGNWMEKRRTAALQLQAGKLGIKFFPTDTPELLSRFAGFRLFTRGDTHKVRNVFLSSNGDIEIFVFDLSYSSGNSKNSRFYKQTVVAVSDPELDLPGFALGPEDFTMKICTMLGYQDIDFEEFPIFSNSFILSGDNEDAVRKAFNKDVIRFFEENTGLSTEGKGNTLIVYRRDKRQKPGRISELIEMGKAVADFFYGVE